MPTFVKDAGQYKPVVKVWQKVAGVWQVVPKAWVRFGGQYKLVHETRNPFYYNVTLTTQYNFNLRDALIAAGWNQTDYVRATVTIPAGVSLLASTTGFYAFNTGITYPPDSTLTIILNGAIAGMGGRGADASPGTSGAANNASAGGPALFTNIPTILTGTGLLVAGGGGGGGGGGCVTNGPFVGPGRGGGGGGGGGNGGGPGGAAGGQSGAPAYWGVCRGSGNGAAGPATAGGGGGAGAYMCNSFVGGSFSEGGAGGAGGLGSAGAWGANPNYGLPSGYWLVSSFGPSGPANGGAAYQGPVDYLGFSGTIIGLRG